MTINLYSRNLTSISKKLKSSSKILKYISSITIDKSFEGNGYVFNYDDNPVKFGEFPELESPNKIVAQITFLEWIKKAENFERLNINNDLKGILAEASDLKQKNISHEDLKRDILKYLETDTLFYWDFFGSELRSKQEYHWGNALNLFALKMNIPNLKFTDSLFGLQQDNSVVIKFIDFLKDLNYFQLASFSNLVKSTKSAILSWGFIKNIFTAHDTVRLSILELDHQSNKWGKQREYHDLSEVNLLKKVLLCKLFFKH